MSAPERSVSERDQHVPTSPPRHPPVDLAPPCRRRGRAVVVIGGAALVVHADDDPGAAFRTAVATKGDVAHRYSGVATIEPVSQALVAFPSTARSSSVDVVVGDVVAIGQQLATLDTRRARTRAACEAGGAGPGGAGAVGRARRRRSVVARPGLRPGSRRLRLAGGGDERAIAGGVERCLVERRWRDRRRATSGARRAARRRRCHGRRRAAPWTRPTRSARQSPTRLDPVAAIAACQTALDAVVAAHQAVAAAQANVSAASTELDGLLGRLVLRTRGGIGGHHDPRDATTETPATTTETGPTDPTGKSTGTPHDGDRTAEGSRRRRRMQRAPTGGRWRRQPRGDGLDPVGRQGGSTTNQHADRPGPDRLPVLRRRRPVRRRVGDAGPRPGVDRQPDRRHGHGGESGDR